MSYARTHIAEHSIAATRDGGWNWQFDPGILGAVGDMLPRDEELGRIGNLVDVVRGEHSAIVTAEHAMRITALLRRSRGPVEVPEAHHHLMLDQPLALICLLRALLA
jgi:pimeloyl-ACP methyl ester carboxylesterase